MKRVVGVYEGRASPDQLPGENYTYFAQVLNMFVNLPPQSVATSPQNISRYGGILQVGWSFANVFINKTHLPGLKRSKSDFYVFHHKNRPAFNCRSLNSNHVSLARGLQATLALYDIEEQAAYAGGGQQHPKDAEVDGAFRGNRSFLGGDSGTPLRTQISCVVVLGIVAGGFFQIAIGGESRRTRCIAGIVSCLLFGSALLLFLPIF